MIIHTSGAIPITGVGSGMQGTGRASPLDFPGTDVVDRGLIVLFFGLFLLVPPGKFSADAFDSSC